MADPIGESINRLEDVAAMSNDLDNVLAKSVFLPITTLFASIAGLLYSLFAVPISLFEALGRVVGSLVNALFGGAADFLGVGWEVSAQSLASGIWNQFGPFSILLVAGIFLGIFYLFARYRAIDVTGNVIPGFSDIPAWFPLIGQDEDEA